MNESPHVTTMSSLALCGLSLSCFWTIIRKRSMLIISSTAAPSITKNQKSMAETRQKTSPKIQLVVTTVTRAKGMFKMANIMSANARLASRMLMAERMADLWYTIRHTTMFPDSATKRMAAMTKQKKICRGRPMPCWISRAFAVGVTGSEGDPEPREMFATERSSIGSLSERFSNLVTTQQKRLLMSPVSRRGTVVERTMLLEGEQASLQESSHKI